MNLNDLRTEADAEHPPVNIGLGDGTDATLTPLLRLPQTVRDTVMAKLDDLDSQDAGVPSRPTGRRTSPPTSCGWWLTRASSW